VKPGSVTGPVTLARHFRRALDLTNDGCSGVPDFDFRSCCDQHDFFYRNGIVCRAEADRVLRECIASHGWVLLPWVYWFGVRVAGWRFFRWDRRADWLADIGEDAKAVRAAVIDNRMAYRAARHKHPSVVIMSWVLKRAWHALGVRVRV
jgi:hypothetical protein